MAATSGFYFAILFMMEYRVFTRLVHFSQNIMKRKRSLPPQVFIDQDVDAEKRKVNDMSMEDMCDVNLVLKNLSKYYKDFSAVNQISVAIKR